jgi:hypothetical protein
MKFMKKQVSKDSIGNEAKEIVALLKIANEKLVEIVKLIEQFAKESRGGF